MNSSTSMINNLLEWIDPKSYVLESSAGRGDIASRLVLEKQCMVDCVELNKNNANFLASSGLYKNVLYGDFLRQTFFDKEVYDYAVAIPPYKDNIDCQHIMAMYEVVKPGGKVISYTLPYWITGIYVNQVVFRKWLKGKDYRIQFEEDESYVGCPKALLIISKPLI